MVYYDKINFFIQQFLNQYKYNGTSFTLLQDELRYLYIYENIFLIYYMGKGDRQIAILGTFLNILTNKWSYPETLSVQT